MTGSVHQIGADFAVAVFIDERAGFVVEVREIAIATAEHIVAIGVAIKFVTKQAADDDDASTEAETTTLTEVFGIAAMVAIETAVSGCAAAVGAAAFESALAGVAAFGLTATFELFAANGGGRVDTLGDDYGWPRLLLYRLLHRLLHFGLDVLMRLLGGRLLAVADRLAIFIHSLRRNRRQIHKP